MEKNKNVFFIAALMLLCQQAEASDAQEEHPNSKARLPQEAFNIQADYMSFKELHALSQTSKEGLVRVKNYFKFKENIMKNTKCPVLTKEWIIEHSGKELSMGWSSFIVPARGDVFDQQPIAEIDGIKWATHLDLKPTFKLDQLPNELIARDELQEHELGETHGGSKGKTVVRLCHYEPNSEVKIVLHLEMEKPFFDTDVPGAQ